MRRPERNSGVRLAMDLAAIRLSDLDSALRKAEKRRAVDHAPRRRQRLSAARPGEPMRFLGWATEAKNCWDVTLWDGTSVAQLRKTATYKDFVRACLAHCWALRLEPPMDEGQDA